mmetsp:Transcript_14969/g.30418  ORF Transcript_14969/g.30418 Transcript_14969/m.30418 type:complete len:265 (-) Transcript_14969:901-1695(-)|eukprot:CAMPEP_0184689042 /NCGR_PEP_ID=MMETSP0312-20130426/30431_1 /TAXON_ID=31354 /ORGANISM="Compsopogon coeruleus, Strain SAG 36.94" /LENGTH=264 /DNA_ID=CAMNT_0027146337 /DNA_START=45 /DNA_END=839 /DNA_ORIENTATION=+
MEDANDLDAILDSALEEFEGTGGGYGVGGVVDGSERVGVEKVLDELNANIRKPLSGDGGERGVEGGDRSCEDEDGREIEEMIASIQKQLETMGAGDDEFAGALTAMMKTVENSKSAATATGDKDGAAGSGSGNPTTEFEGMVEKMVQQILSKEVMLGPMRQMRDQYRVLFEEDAASISQEDLDRYSKQRSFVEQICEAYERDAGTEEIMDLLQGMQEFGAAPPAVVNTLSAGEGLDREDSNTPGVLDPSDLEKLEKLQEQCNVQ